MTFDIFFCNLLNLGIQKQVDEKRWTRRLYPETLNISALFDALKKVYLGIPEEFTRSNLASLLKTPDMHF